MWKPRLFLLSLLALATPALPGLEASDRPNIVFILADDLGWRDTSVTGSTFYQTPNIDRLAAEGVRFTDAYATPLCSPSRGAVLTGRYPERFQMYTAITRASQDDPEAAEEGQPHQNTLLPGSRSHLPLEEITIAEVLQDAGYYTAFIGKWHLGAPRYHPQHQGFEEVVVAGGAAAGYFSPYKFLPASFSSGPDGEYLTERMTEEAITILREAVDEGEPLFLALWHFNVHTPLQAKGEVIDKYEKLVDPRNPQLHPVMGAMIEGLDDSVGAILSELEALGAADETIVVFASDNGGVGWPEAGDEMPPTSNLPMRGWKGTLFEGGVRVPMIVKWPGVAKPGSVYRTPVHLVDLFPTFVGAANAMVPPTVELDGVDLRPLITGESQERKHPVIHYFPIEFRVNGARSAAAIRDGDYKLIRFFSEGPNQSDEFELYDVVEDPAESADLSKRMPDLANAMAQKLAAELQRIDARIPEPNPAYDPDAPIPPPWRGRFYEP